MLIDIHCVCPLEFPGHPQNRPCLSSVLQTRKLGFWWNMSQPEVSHGIGAFHLMEFR